ncbi:MAG TPA: lysylphosphatidylglycerol synthase transmembrane domain-containing protein [Gaiellaceae bacterium]|nr:lysylphosphatidylglycerol synthase transmembrane domain-containing protein [Gaiellaceae bacterium]
MHAFFHAVTVFFDHLAAVRWEFLAAALGLHLAKLVFRVIAWRTILRASYPGQRIRFLSVFGAYAAGVGVNSIVPARGGDAVKLFLIKRRIAESSYTTLTPTLVAETAFDFFVAGGLMIWALSIGVLPTHQVYSRLPSVDWGFFAEYREATEIGLGVLLGAAAIGIILLLEHGESFRRRVGRGFAIMRDPWRLVRGVVAPQAFSWVLRIGSVYFFLRAFGVHASLHNALLAQVVESLATLFPATPGGAGTKQGLIVFLFRGQAVSKSLLLAFSVGMNLALVVFNVVLGFTALALMARTISWKKLRVEEAAAGAD